MKINLRQSLRALLRPSALVAALASGLAGPNSFAGTQSKPGGPPAKPTIVLVHGAFADTSSWNGVVARLLVRGYPVVAVAAPLRGLRSDTDYLSALVQSIPGPVVAVGHSYGGLVITDAAAVNPSIKALVYVAAFAPEVGESAADLTDRFPGSTLGPALAAPVALPGGEKDLYIQQDKYPAQFAADVPKADAMVLSAAQRPVVEAALHDPARFASWQAIPSWFIFGSGDRNIPEAAHAFMAARADARETVEIPGASHVLMISHADAVAALIDRAARTVMAAPVKSALASAELVR